jgi:hypothetical protein
VLVFQAVDMVLVSRFPETSYKAIFQRNILTVKAGDKKKKISGSF